MVEVCDICGDKGFSNALLFCSKCSVVSVHQYCLGIPPGSIDDTFDWICEYCSVPLETESCRKFGALQSCNGDLKINGRSEIIALLEQPEPLCTLPPIEKHGSPTRENISKFSQEQEQETPISPFMENPNSIMRGLVLLVSPLGEVFIEEEKEKGICEISIISSLVGHIRRLSNRSKKSGTFKAKRDLSPLGKTNSEVEASEEKDDISLLSTSSELNVEVSDQGIASSENKSDNGRLGNCLDDPEEYENSVWSENSVESSMNNSKRGKRKRILEAKSEVINHKKAKFKGDDDEGPSSEQVENPENCRVKFDANRKLSSGMSLAQMQKRVRNQIVAMLLSAGWTVEYRERKIGKCRRQKDRVFLNPKGKAYWSMPEAYLSLEQDFEKAKSGDGNGTVNSNFCFKPLSKEMLSILRKKDHRSNKKILNLDIP